MKHIKLYWKMVKSDIALVLMYGAKMIIASDEVISDAFHKAIADQIAEFVATKERSVFDDC